MLLDSSGIIDRNFWILLVCSDHDALDLIWQYCQVWYRRIWSVREGAIFYCDSTVLRHILFMFIHTLADGRSGVTSPVGYWHALHESFAYSETGWDHPTDWRRHFLPWNQLQKGDSSIGFIETHAGLEGGYMLTGHPGFIIGRRW